MGKDQGVDKVHSILDFLTFSFIRGCLISFTRAHLLSSAKPPTPGWFSCCHLPVPSSDILFHCQGPLWYIGPIGRGGGREKERERNISQLPLTHPKLGAWPTTQACALTGNWTCDLLVCRPGLNPLSITSQGTIYFKVNCLATWFPSANLIYLCHMTSHAHRLVDENVDVFGPFFCLLPVSYTHLRAHET